MFHFTCFMSQMKENMVPKFPVYQSVGAMAHKLNKIWIPNWIVRALCKYKRLIYLDKYLFRERIEGG